MIHMSVWFNHVHIGLSDEIKNALENFFRRGSFPFDFLR